MDALQSTDGSRSVVDYVDTLRRRWWIIVIGVVIGLAAGIALTMLQSKTYSSSTSVIVKAAQGTDSTQVANARTSSGVNLDTEAQIVQSQLVAQAAKTLLKSSSTPSQLLTNVTVTVPPNTQVLDVSYSAGTPKAAQAGSRAFAQAYLDQRQAAANQSTQTQVAALQQQRAALQAQLNTAAGQIASLPTNSVDRQRAQADQTILGSQLSSIGTRLSNLLSGDTSSGSIISEATLPTSPTSPNKLLDVGSATAVGLLLGLALALLADALDRRVRATSQARRASNLPVLLELPSGRFDGVLGNGAGGSARHVDRLRNAVVSMLSSARGPSHPDEGHTLLVTGASAGAGAGLVAASLAIALAKSGRAVTFVCANPESAALRVLGLGHGVGLADVLRGDLALAAAARPMPGVAGLRVVTPGTDADSAEGLTADRVGGVLDASGDGYVVVETRPARTSADAQAVAAVVDLSIVVVERKRTRRSDLAEVAEEFAQVGSITAGMVVMPVAKLPRQSKAVRTAAMTPDVTASGPGEAQAAAQPELHGATMSSARAADGAAVRD